MSNLENLRRLLALKEVRKIRSRETLAGAMIAEERWTKAATEAWNDVRDAEHLAETYVSARLELLQTDAAFEAVYTSLIAGAVSARHTVTVYDERAQSREQKAVSAKAASATAARAHLAADAEVRRFEEVLDRLTKVVRQRSEILFEDDMAELAVRRVCHG
jgi:hypothetical protein